MFVKIPMGLTPFMFGKVLTRLTLLYSYVIKGSISIRFGSHMKMITLSRLNITGPLDELTPICVIEEISRAHNISVEELSIKESIDKLNNSSMGVLDVKAVPENLNLMFSFVNRDHIWTTETFIPSLCFLVTFFDDKTELPPKFECGPQTSSSPHNINACVMYKFCRKKAIKTRREMSLEEMKEAYLLSNLSDEDLHSILVKQISLMTKSEKLDLILELRAREDYGNSLERSRENENYLGRSGNSQVFLGESREGKPGNSQAFLGRLENLLDIRRGGKKKIEVSYNDIIRVSSIPLRPFSFSQAIYLGASKYKIDLSYCDDPIEEYIHISTLYPSVIIKSKIENPFEWCHLSIGERKSLAKIWKDEYKPRDEGMREIWLRAPDILDLTLSFNPLFPECCYEKSQLISLVSQEGCRSGISNYEILQTAFVSNTFYHGLYPETINKETPFELEDIGELDPSSIICYGSRGSKTLKAMSVGELERMFRVSLNFTDPFDRSSLFSSSSITKLKKIASDHGFSSLLSVIVEVECLERFMDEKGKILMKEYQKKPEIREGIRSALTALLDLSMYMRGWNGAPEPLPIKEAPVDNQEVVDVHVVNAIRSLELKCQALGSYSSLILSLPLLNWKNGYYPSTDPKEGLTIGERIEIIKLGNTFKGTASCIRLTSNKFAASAHRYMRALSMPVPFNIKALQSIS